MSLKELDNTHFQVASGFFVRITDYSVLFEDGHRPSVELFLDEFQELAERVREAQNDAEAIGPYYLASILQELAQRFGEQVLVIEIKRELPGTYPKIRYIVSLVDNRSGLVHTCRTRGEYKQILRKLHDVKTR